MQVRQDIQLHKRRIFSKRTPPSSCRPILCVNENARTQWGRPGRLVLASSDVVRVIALIIQSDSCRAYSCGH